MISSLTEDIKSTFRDMLLLNPIEHAYPIWHLEHRNELCKWLIWLQGKTPQCYMLIYKGFKEPDVHLRSLVQDHDVEIKLKELLSKIEYTKFVLHMRRRHLKILSDVKLNAEVKGVYGVKVMECVKLTLTEEHKVIELKPMDWPAIIDIISEVLRARRVHYASPSLEAYSYLTSYRTFAVVKNGRAIAMASIVASTPYVSVIGNVYTLKDYRGMGYGKAVTSRALAEALKCSKRVIVWVREDNVSAIKLYESLGFKHIMDDAWINVGVAFNP